MGAFTTEAIVLRRADWRDHDRILTLLTPRGRLEVLSRGCRRPKSPLLGCSEVFTMGNFELFSNREHCMLQNCQVTDGFYPLRQDFDRLSCAAYLVNVCEAAVQEGENAATPFLLLARALGYLSYHTEYTPRAVLTAFLLHFNIAQGYRPRLNHCVNCGKELMQPQRVFFDIEQGGVTCLECREEPCRGGILEGRELLWLRESEKKGVKGELPPEDAPLTLMQGFTETRLEKRVPPLMVRL